jgi:UPF0755 protein
MKKIIIIMVVLILLAIPAGGFYYFYTNFEKPISADPINSDIEEISIIVEEGDNSQAVSEKLFNSGITPNIYTYYYFVRSRGVGANIKAGEYEIKPAIMTLNDIALVFEGGMSERDQVKITIPEGYTSKQIEETLFDSELTNIADGDLLSLVNYKGEYSDSRTTEIQDLYDQLEDKYYFLNEQPDSEYKGLEGYLFPDTYHFHKEDGLDVIVDKMLSNFEDKLTEDLLMQIDADGKTLHEVINMASIVQRESGKSYEEDQKIAGVFYNRIDENIILGSCSTLQYLTNTNKFQYSYEDTQIDSPYNTYKVAGLPPGPIANPGLDSIRATINAEDHDFYFFLNTEDGELIFSRTEAEHNSNKNKYLD